MYARVLLDSLEGKPPAGIEKIAQKFKHLLKKRGDLRLMSQIIRELKAFQGEKEGKRAQVISAFALAEDAKLVLQKSLKQRGFRMEEKVEPKLIGGTAIFLEKEFLVDGTVRGRLQRIAQLVKS